MKQNIFLSAGEISGDVCGSFLVAELMKQPDLYLYGLGGPRMATAGMHVDYDISDINVIGIVEHLKYRRVLRQKQYLQKALTLIEKKKPDVAILIDNQKFNIPFARILHKKGIKTLYYFPPSIYVWRRGLARTLPKYVDVFLVPFYTDYTIYQKTSSQTHFVGHPFVDTVWPDKSKKETRKEWNLLPGQFLVGLLPGSRTSEIQEFLEDVLESAKIINNSCDCQFWLPVGNQELTQEIIHKVKQFKSLTIHVSETLDYNLLNACDAALISSGTATLESSLLGVPTVLFYRIHPISFWIARSMVKTKWIGLPNVIAGQKIIPELLQSAMNPQSMADAILDYLHNPEKSQHISMQLKNLREKLGRKGVIHSTAQLVLEELRR